MKRRFAAAGLILVASSLALTEPRSNAAGDVPVTLLHTNDLHSHFRPEKSALNLGGVARIKTAVDRARKKTPGALLVDGGDWSEGDIYYTEGAGRETLRMMDDIGYDVAVVGNHDWLNGPDTLLDAIASANPRMALVGANFNVSHYARADEFKKRILPYAIREVNGAKIAFIGLGTYEIIYDKFFAPVKITEPFLLTRDLARDLKQNGQADAVVVISHNRIATNQAILTAAPDVDLVIGAHDHVKLTAPVVVQRPGAKPGWVVETGCWGQYLGRVDLSITPGSAGNPASVTLKTYRLLQMDRSIPEDARIQDRLAKLEAAIEGRMGPIFHDELGTSQIELYREGIETPMGNFTADAYRLATGADLAIDERNFIYGALHEGVIRSVDVYNSNPAIWNPRTGKAWTLKTMPMSGHTIDWILNLFLGWKQLALSQMMIFSGVKVVFNPLNAADSSGLSALGISIPVELLEGRGPIRSLEIDGSPLDQSRTYRVALGGGVVEAIEFLDSMMPGMVPGTMSDTGRESWRVMADYLRSLKVLTEKNVPVGNRLITEQQDLGVLANDVRFTPTQKTATGARGHLQVVVRNYGAATSIPGAVLQVLSNSNGADLSRDPRYTEISAAQPIDSLAPGAARTYDFDVTLAADRGVYPVTAMIRGNSTEVNRKNDETTRYFPAAGR